ncbi:hypothetical protein DFH94DRAFT_496367 [Russula ochroleuca]|jgi:hypothetical protein|uniref:Uncharacterized protein n=1 Tax=Russula ochroleuca TaxID=152965 RepID=A0A9P5MVG9_9AGAM|nr:hypothetical protein DFH94DRAFT_496367 [Russula ochroleuca]
MARVVCELSLPSLLTPTGMANSYPDFISFIVLHFSPSHELPPPSSLSYRVIPQSLIDRRPSPPLSGPLMIDDGTLPSPKGKTLL